jgi:hypothetical protein
MKLSRSFFFGALTAAFLALPPWLAVAQTDQDVIEVARSVIKADRQAIVAQTLQLTEVESNAFWPLYHQYRAEMDKVGDRLVKLIQDYARFYPNVPEDRAKKMLKNLTELESKQVKTRVAFLKKFGKVLPAAKNLRFAQVENRLDLALRLKLASAIPLVPIEGRMSADTTSGAAVVEGVPGGVVVQTHEVTATVAAIDQAHRRVTLVSSDGIKQTVKAGPEVINFDQIRVGDQLKVKVAEELVAYLAEVGAPANDSAATLVALAPKGAKPGGVVADTVQVTAKVTAIDLKQHTATLQFADGSTRTVAVRQDVDLTRRHVGEAVVIRMTEMLAISVEKPQ